MGFRKFKAVSLSCLVIMLSMWCSMGVITARAEGPIKIGAFFALSGPAASIGTPTKLVAQMVVDKINKEGGINKRPLEMATGDTESDPTKALMEAKRLVEKDKAVALIGPTRTDEGLASKPYIEDTAHLPIVMTIGGDPGDCGRQIWPLQVDLQNTPTHLHCREKGL